MSKNDEDCPLNGFGISITEDDPKYEGYETKEVLDSNDFTVYYLYYTNNNVEGHVITEFKLSHGTPCAKVSEKNWIKFYSNEVEENYKCKTEINGNVYNTRYIKVSDEGINIRSLYADNGLRGIHPRPRPETASARPRTRPGRPGLWPTA